MLTNERINRMVGRTNWLLLTFANGTQSVALNPVAARNFARAIEAEVLQSQELVGGITPFNPLNAASNVLPCRAQNAIHAPQDVLQNADATQAQEPVAWFTDDNVCDKSATTYDPKVAQRWKEKGWPVTALYAAPQLPVPCPKCSKWELEWKMCHSMYEQEVEALEAKVADLESLRAQDAKAYERLDELRNRDADKMAEQSAEIERIKASISYGALMKWQAECTQHEATIAQQAERITEFERSISTDTETIVRLHEKVAAQAALIEKALQQVGQALAWLAFGECRSYGEGVPLLIPSEADDLCKEALAAIAAHQK